MRRLFFVLTVQTIVGGACVLGEPAAVADQPPRLLQVSEAIWTGGQPSGLKAFQYLAAQGVRTVICVDGAIPDVASARAAGLETVHIPMRYDKVSAPILQSIVKVLREKSGPWFFHCHHGTHRGPTAAALALRERTGCGAEEAARVLEKAGTNPGYLGLWQAVADFQSPTDISAAPALVEVARVADFTAAMARIDRIWDRVEDCRKEDWQIPPNHPDIDPARETLILLEAFEGLQVPGVGPAAEDPAFPRALDQVRQRARILHAAVLKGDREKADAEFRSVKRACLSCHRTWREAPVRLESSTRGNPL